MVRRGRGWLVVEIAVEIVENEDLGGKNENFRKIT